MKNKLDFSLQQMLTQYKDDINGQTVYCGLSAGADSTCLFSLLNKKKDKFNFKLHAVFFSHGDSPIAVKEDVMLSVCQKLCKEYGVELTVVPLQLKIIDNQGWESSGRIMRQKFYNDMGAKFVFLGHHEDDQNETTMTQLLRGGAGRGASGMKSVEGIYYRPLLSHKKSEIYEYLRENNIEWIEDPTNTNSDFTRNFWRNKALPLIEEHYPDYSKKLNNFRTQLNELHQLAYDMALEDGLEEFISGDFCRSVKDLSEVRLKNLIKHYFQYQKINLTDRNYQEFLKSYKNNFVREIGNDEHKFYLFSNILSNTTNLLPAPKEKKVKSQPKI